MLESPEIWWSIVLGGLLGVCYIASFAFVTYLAKRSSQFVLIVLGGMLARMMGALAALFLSAVLLPVSMPAFVGAFLCVFLVGIGVEVLWFLRRN